MENLALSSYYIVGIGKTIDEGGKRQVGVLKLPDVHSEFSPHCFPQSVSLAHVATILPFTRFRVGPDLR